MTKRPAAKAKRGWVTCWAFTYKNVSDHEGRRSEIIVSAWDSLGLAKEQRAAAVGYRLKPSKLKRITLPLPAPGKK